MWSNVITVLSIENREEFPKELWETLLEFVPEPLQKKANTFRFWKDRQAFLLGRCLLLLVLRRHTDKSLKDVYYDEFGKPTIGTQMAFNISHAGSFVLCAFSTNEEAIGIDIEQISEGIDLELFTNILSDQEWEDVMEAPCKYTRFFDYWTIKEAVSKADGRGLNIPLDKIRLNAAGVTVENKQWFINKLEIDKSHPCHLVASKPIYEVEIHTLDSTELVYHLLLVQNLYKQTS